MAKVFLAATVLTGILAVSGCIGPLPGGGGYGYGGDPFYGAQPFPYYPGGGAYYGSQPYYEPQPYGYYGTTEGYGYQPGPGGYAGPPPGYWRDRRHQYQEERFRRGMGSGQWSPGESRRFQREQARFRGSEGRMRGNGDLSPRERGHQSAMQPRNSQDFYRGRHNGMQTGPTAQIRPTGPSWPQAQVRQSSPSRITTQTRTTTQGRTTAQGRQDR